MARPLHANNRFSFAQTQSSKKKAVTMMTQGNDYLSVRREPFLDETSYRTAVTYLTKESIPELVRDLQSGEVKHEYVGYGLHNLGSKYMDVALLRYSAGEPVAEMREPILSAINEFDKNVECEMPAVAYFDLATQDIYVEALWLLSLAKLLGLGEAHVERVANIYAADETNDGADELFELILAKLGRKSFAAEGLIHEDPYQLLLDCIKAEPEQRPALMTQFLKRWYKGQKECDWWGSHIPRKGTTVLDTGFFGYWAFEAALVTYLWDIDDRSYRDLPHYPKDLIDYARANFPLTSTGTGGIRLRCEAGQPCPREGWWFTPARMNSRRHFKAGEVMPDLKSDWGMTIWQWDEQQ
jgi:hypothetical protein